MYLNVSELGICLLYIVYIWNATNDFTCQWVRAHWWYDE